MGRASEIQSEEAITKGKIQARRDPQAAGASKLVMTKIRVLAQEVLQKTGLAFLCCVRSKLLRVSHAAWRCDFQCLQHLLRENANSHRRTWRNKSQSMTPSRAKTRNTDARKTLHTLRRGPHCGLRAVNSTQASDRTTQAPQLKLQTAISKVLISHWKNE